MCFALGSRFLPNLTTGLRVSPETATLVLDYCSKFCASPYLQHTAPASSGLSLQICPSENLSTPDHRESHATLCPQLFAQLFVSSDVSLDSNAHGQFRLSDTPVRNGLKSRVASSTRRYQQEPRQKLQTQLSVRDDFRKLQLVNTDLMTRMFVRSSFAIQEITQKEVRSSLGEIRKIAKRLRLDLAIPEVKESETSYNVTLSPGLLLLDKAVMSFVENPLFAQPSYRCGTGSRAERILMRFCCSVISSQTHERRITKELWCSGRSMRILILMHRNHLSSPSRA